MNVHLKYEPAASYTWQVYVGDTQVKLYKIAWFARRHVKRVKRNLALVEAWNS